MTRKLFKLVLAIAAGFALALPIAALATGTALTFDGRYSTDAAYATGSTVTLNGQTYFCNGLQDGGCALGDLPNVGTWNGGSGNWSAMSSQPENQALTLIGAWSSGTAYSQLEGVFGSDSHVYVCGNSVCATTDNPVGSETGHWVPWPVGATGPTGPTGAAGGYSDGDAVVLDTASCNALTLSLASDGGPIVPTSTTLPCLSISAGQLLDLNARFWGRSALGLNPNKGP